MLAVTMFALWSFSLPPPSWACPAAPPLRFLQAWSGNHSLTLLSIVSQCKTRKYQNIFCHFTFHRIPPPTKLDLTSHQVERRYPVDHPQTSHIPKTDLLPSSTPNEDVSVQNDDDYIHPADSPASAPQPYIHSKTRGAPYRHELINIPLDSKRKPMTWPQAQNYQVRIQSNYCIHF